MKVVGVSDVNDIKMRAFLHNAEIKHLYKLGESKKGSLKTAVYQTVQYDWMPSFRFAIISGVVQENKYPEYFKDLIHAMRIE